MVLSFFGSIGPLIGGRLADYFTNRSLTINIEWMSPQSQKVFHLLSLHDWNFLFLIGALLALLAIELLVHVNEVGEVEKDFVVRIMRHSIKTNLRDFFIIGTLMSWQEQLWEIVKRKLTFRAERE